MTIKEFNVTILSDGMVVYTYHNESEKEDKEYE